MAKVQNLLGIPTGPRLQGAGRARYEKALDAAYAKFVAVDADNSGTVDCREFCKAFNLEFNIFTQRLWRLFDLDGSGDISFREFLFGACASRMHARAHNTNCKLTPRLAHNKRSIEICVERRERQGDLRVSPV